MLARLRALVGPLAAPHRRDLRPRVVRRAAIHCPHGGTPVEVDLLLDETGRPALVLRCTARRDSPPSCDQACRRLAEAIEGPAVALLICPPGTEPPQELD